MVRPRRYPLAVAYPPWPVALVGLWLNTRIGVLCSKSELQELFPRPPSRQRPGNLTLIESSADPTAAAAPKAMSAGLGFAWPSDPGNAWPNRHARACPRAMRPGLVCRTGPSQPWIGVSIPARGNAPGGPGRLSLIAPGPAGSVRGLAHADAPGRLPVGPGEAVARADDMVRKPRYAQSAHGNQAPALATKSEVTRLITKAGRWCAAQRFATWFARKPGRAAHCFRKLQS